MRSISKIKKYTAAISDLLNSKPLDKVRISEICEMCGTDRQNFYYYFRDKYDLAAWIFIIDYNEALVGQKTNEIERRMAMLEKIMTNAEVYKKLFNDNSQNSLRSYLWENAEKMAEYIKEKNTGEGKLSNKERCILLIKFNEWIESVVLWLDGKYNISLQELAEIHFNETQDELEGEYYYYAEQILDRFNLP